MKVGGFTIVRNAVLYDYPIVESIRSALPLVDEMIVAVGKSADTTRDLVASINDPKIRIVDTVWDESVRTGGHVLAQQTDIAMEHSDGDWLLYLQADEVLHETDYQGIRKSMSQYRDHASIEGLSFRYHHFRADYGIRDPLPYRKQTRIIRPGIGIHSHGDACGFRRDGKRLKTAATGAWVYHYGYVRPPKKLAAKMDYFTSLYQDRYVEPGQEDPDLQYILDLGVCERFHGSHPEVMQQRIAGKDWETPDIILMSRWRNPKFWGGLWHKNSRTIRRWKDRLSGGQRRAAA